MAQLALDGTRFRLFPQYDEGFEPEVVEVSSPRGSLRDGPADERMYVADAVTKSAPYNPPSYAPPYRGRMFAPARPDADGHFTGLPLATAQFRAAHLFGSVRFVLDVWESKLGGAFPWFHPDAPPRLELVPFTTWRNAQSGPGFLEMGYWPSETPHLLQPFCLNFDVVAHEVGHAILFGMLGVADIDRLGAQFFAAHEGLSDFMALLAALHFDSVRARLLAQTSGNLYALNMLNRLGELTRHQQIRLASNYTTMADVADIRLAPDGEWVDPTGLGRNAHALAEPLVGAVFDVLVELYQAGLVARGAIPRPADARPWSRATIESSLAGLQAMHVRAYGRFKDDFEAALVAARDVVSTGIVRVLQTLEPGTLQFADVARCVLEAVELGGGRELLAPCLDCFLERGIVPSGWEASIPTRPVRAAADTHGRAATPSVCFGCRCAQAGLGAVSRARSFMRHSYRAA